MNRIDLPPGSSVRVGRSDGNLDQVLGAYFKSELPAEWPALHLPHSARIAAPSATHKSAGAVRSRLALAASVALLLLGQLWLTGRAPVRERTGARAPTATWEAKRPQHSRSTSRTLQSELPPRLPR